MSSTDGLVRGLDAVDTGSPIRVPVGRETLGRVFNLLGDPVDEQPAPETQERWPIHRDAPSYEEQAASSEVLETGIKVIDLIACGRRQDRSDPGADQQRREPARRHLGLYRCRRAYP